MLNVLELFALLKLRSHSTAVILRRLAYVLIIMNFFFFIAGLCHVLISSKEIALVTQFRVKLSLHWR